MAPEPKISPEEKKFQIFVIQKILLVKFLNKLKKLRNPLKEYWQSYVVRELSNQLKPKEKSYILRCNLWKRKMTC